jgi:hypothetical protein
VPTATPTAGPTGNPRTGPDPLDPKDGLPSSETTELNLRAVFSASRPRVDLTITLTGELNKSCKFTMQLADNLAFRNAKTFTLRQVSRTRLSLLPVTSVRNAKDKVYFRSVYSGCGGETVQSEVAEIIPFSARMRIKETPIKWIRRF